jgi:hypothetical protein
MKTNILFAALVVPFWVLGQSADPEVYELRWSRQYPNREIQLDYVSALDSTSFTTYGSISGGLFSKPKNFFARYDRETMSQLWQLEEVPEDYQGLPVVFRRMITVQETSYVYYSAYSRAKDKRYVLLRTINANGDISNLKELLQVPAMRIREGNFSVAWDASQKGFALVSFPDVALREEVQVSVHRFDREGEELGSQRVRIDYSKRDIDFVDVDYAINGDVYLLAVRRAERNRGDLRGFAQPNREFLILHADSDDELFQEVDLGLAGKFIVGGVSVEADQIPGKVNITGMYSDLRYGTTTGMFYLTLDQKTLQASSADFESLRDFELINSGIRDGMARARRRGVANEEFRFRESVPRLGGGSLVVMEDMDVRVVTTTNRGVTTTTYYYYYDNIWAMLVDAQGQIEKVVVLPKFQYSVNDGGRFLGFELARDGQDFLFFFNDAKGNQKRWAEGQSPRVMRQAARGCLAMVRMKPDGSLTYHEVIDNPKERSVLLPTRGTTFIDYPGEVVMPGLKRGRWVFMSLRPERN